MGDVAEGNPPPAAARLGRGGALVGPKIAAIWSEYAALTPEALAAKLAPYVGQGLRGLAAEAGGIGLLVVQFLLTITIAAVMYSGGETAASGMRKFSARFAGERGEGVVAARLPGNSRASRSASSSLRLYSRSWRHRPVWWPGFLLPACSPP